jgi:hypothetical protein
VENTLILPFTNSYWVEGNKLIAGEYPGTFIGKATRRRIQSLIKIGVRTIIDLTREEDSAFPYSSILSDVALDHGLKVDWKNHPISDMATPSISLMIQILDEIDDAISRGGVVYVHCFAGIGRTGTVVGCYLVRHGLPGEVAIEQIAHLRKDLPNWWHTSPEVPDQMEFIRNWKIGQ